MKKCYDLSAELKGLYLDWFNNYLSVEVFAEHYQIAVEDAKKIISIGRSIHNYEFAEVTNNE